MQICRKKCDCPYRRLVQMEDDLEFLPRNRKISPSEEETFKSSVFGMAERQIEKGIYMGVMVTDCCDALINSVKSVFPISGHILCRWHMYMNLSKDLKGKVISAEDWDPFINRITDIISSSSVPEYHKKLMALRNEITQFIGKTGKDYSPAISYLEKTWLKKKESLVSACHMHLGVTTTQRVEGSHYTAVKVNLENRKHGLLTVYTRINDACSLQYNNIVTSYKVPSTLVRKGPNIHPSIEYLSPVITREAMLRVSEQINIIEEVLGGRKAVTECTCKFTRTMGLPCWHTILQIGVEGERRLELSDFLKNDY